MDKRAIRMETNGQSAVGIELECVIRKALADAWARGSDLETANKHAIAKILELRPDMRAADARSATGIVRRSS